MTSLSVARDRSMGTGHGAGPQRASHPRGPSSTNVTPSPSGTALTTLWNNVSFLLCGSGLCRCRRLRGPLGEVNVARFLVRLSLAGLLLCLGALVSLPGLAAAYPGINISSRGKGCTLPNVYFCLFYSPGGMTRTPPSASYGRDYNVPDITSDFFGDPGSAGYGAPVRHDAASMSDQSPTCHVTTWVDTTYFGPDNWLTVGRAGTLSSTANFPLRNGEASIDADTCS